MNLKIFMKKFFCTVFCVALFFSASESFAAENSANEKLVRIEKDTYGGEQIGAILDRLNKIEKDFTGRNMQGNMNARIDAVYNILYNDTGEPSIIAKVNALEWNINHEVHNSGIDKRLSDLENSIFGKIGTGNFVERIRTLSKSSFGMENVPMIEMQIPENILVKVSLADSVGSKTLQVGDLVNFVVAEDIFVDDKLIFAKGLQGEGIVTKVRQAKGLMIGNGKVEIDFNKIRCLDGREINIFVGEESKNIMTENKMIDGASLVGMDLNSGLNKALVHRKNIEVDKGTEFYIQTKNPSAVYALIQDNGTVTAVEEKISAVTSTPAPVKTSTPAPVKTPTPEPAKTPTPEPVKTSTPAPVKTPVAPAPTTKKDNKKIFVPVEIDEFAKDE
ncbi:MAG: hypothetical protein IK062_03165 [Selenomonadaceae bacterium]|nr:hypothetical protein [Selenomonadaceae bacterium]